jgi:demethylsterigmatocystin 6-O-methyltransferase
MVGTAMLDKSHPDPLDWTDDRCRAILAQLQAAMQPESMILIDDHVVPERGAHKTVMQMDMTMLLALGAEERTERRWRELVESVGLFIDHIYCYDESGGDSIIVVKTKA